MSLNAAMSCDNCEQTLSLSYADDERVEAVENGWIVVSLPTAYEEDPEEDERDFDADSDVHLCSERCLTVWAAARAVSKGTVEVG